MSCPTSNQVALIQRTECIGNSLNTINDNFNNLREATCDNYNFLQNLNQQISTLDTLVIDLSSIITKGAARAWCRFSGVRDITNFPSLLFTDRLLFGKQNIFSVNRKALGDYVITFETPFIDKNYIMVGTSSIKKNNNSNLYTFFQPYNIQASSASVYVVDSANNKIDPDFASVVFYG